ERPHIGVLGRLRGGAREQRDRGVVRALLDVRLGELDAEVLAFFLGAPDVRVRRASAESNEYHRDPFHGSSYLSARISSTAAGPRINISAAGSRHKASGSVSLVVSLPAFSSRYDTRCLRDATAYSRSIWAMGAPSADAWAITPHIADSSSSPTRRASRRSASAIGTPASSSLAVRRSSSARIGSEWARSCATRPIAAFSARPASRHVTSRSTAAGRPRAI